MTTLSCAIGNGDVVGGEAVSSDKHEGSNAGDGLQFEFQGKVSKLMMNLHYN
jgi:hypothetical protein